MPIQVVISDDHRILRDGLRSVLEEDSEIEVVGESSNGRETVDMVRKLQPDVVVMDISMPDLNGIDATRRIVALKGGCKVLALSMHADEQYVKGMLRAGAAGYVLKDCASEEVLRAIHTVVRNRVYMSPDVAGVIVSDYMSHLSGEAAPEAQVLSGREREVLQLVAEGWGTSAIAERLHVSVKTIETHRKRLMDKLQIRSVAGLTKYAIREGITSLDD